jgi:pyruvate dehydrogenase E1 component alpha subunit
MPLKELASFRVSRLEILDEQGRVDKDLEPDLGKEQLLELYRHMVWARITDERMLNLQRQGRIGTFGPATGQEAAHIAPMFAADAKDWFVGAFREHGARLMRGESLLRQLMYYNGYEEGNVVEEGSNPRNLPVSVIVGAQALHAVGLAYAMRMKGETETAALAFMGDGATSEGDFHEALNFAAVWNLPVVFVVQNNQWAISVPRSKQTKAGTLAQKAVAYEMPGIQVDGNDVLAMYAATKEALERGRAGGGPTLIEAVTYRLMMHTTADDQYKYRTKEEEEVWWQRDPLLRFRKYLEAREFWSDKDQEALETELKAKMDEQVKAFEAKDDFAPEAPFAHVFGTTHDVIEEQKAAFLEELRKEVGDA